jgi:hypothetical protein
MESKEKESNKQNDQHPNKQEIGVSRGENEQNAFFSEGRERKKPCNLENSFANGEKLLMTSVQSQII